MRKLRWMLMPGICCVLIFMSCMRHRYTHLEPPTPTPTIPVESPSSLGTMEPTPLPKSTQVTNMPDQVSESRSGVISTPSPSRTGSEMQLIHKLSSSGVVQALEWSTDSKRLDYALVEIPSTQKWIWWRYHVDTRKTESLPPRRTLSTRAKETLGLCDVTGCSDEVIINVSPNNMYVVYAPPRATGEYGSGERWISEVDGSDPRLIPGYFTGGVIEWEPQADYVLLERGWDFPLGYLVNTSNLKGGELPDLAKLERCLIVNTDPSFSPAGEEIAFTGWVTSSQQCATWRMELDDYQVTRLSRHVGSMFWSPDGHMLYIMEIAEEKDGFSLYEIDVSAPKHPDKPIVVDVPSKGNLYAPRSCAMSPDKSMLACTEICGDPSLCLVPLD